MEEPRYKVWISLERCYEESGVYEDVGLPFGTVTGFDNEPEAQDFCAWLQSWGEVLAYRQDSLNRIAAEVRDLIVARNPGYAGDLDAVQKDMDTEICPSNCKNPDTILAVLMLTALTLRRKDLKS